MADSLKTASGKYDSIRLDLYSVNGKDTVFSKTLFHGIYTDSSQLKDLPLGEAPARFVIKVVGYRKGAVAFESGVPFAGGKQEGPVVVYKPPEPLVNRPPKITVRPAPPSGAIRLKEGENLSFGIAAEDSDAHDKATLLALSYAGACGASLDDAVGKLNIKPTFQCVATGDSAIDSLVLRAADNAVPPDTTRLVLHLIVGDSNSAPRWSVSSKDLAGKEGKPINLDFAPLFLGDVEGDSVTVTSTCGSADRQKRTWTYTPGFRDAGSLDCDLIASDSHSPVASSRLTLRMSIADSVRVVDVAILSPQRGFITRDSVVHVKWSIGTVTQTLDTTERLKAEGTNWIKRSFRDSVGNYGVDSVNVILDTKPPTKPLVHLATASPSNNPKPTWTWGTGGNGGNGVFQYKLDDSNFVSETSLPSSDTAFTPETSLKEGPHTLYVRERDAAGIWSESFSASIILDLTPPNAPLLTSASFHTLKQKPIWQWSSGGNGNGTFRFGLDNQELAKTGTTTRNSSFSPSTELALGTEHTLYIQERDDAGNWSELSSFSIHVHGQKGYAVGSTGALIRTDDGGASWNALTRPTVSYLNSLWFQDAYRGILVGDSGKVFKTSDAGQSCQPVEIRTKSSIRSIFFLDSKLGFVASGEGGFFRTSDGGNTWDSLSSISGLSIYDMIFSDSLNGIGVVADPVSSKGNFVVTANGGKKWTKAIQDTPYELNSLYAIDQKTVVCVGRGGKILKTLDGGKTWNEMNSGTSDFLSSVFFITREIGFAAGSNGTILKTVDAGTNWSVIPSGSSDFLSTIFFTDDKNGFAAGGHGTLLKTVDGGATWSPITDIPNLTGGDGHFYTIPGFNKLFFP